MKWWKECPLLILLAVSTIFFTVLSAVNRDGIYSAYQTESAIQPMLTAVFRGAKDEVYPWSSADEEKEVLAVMAQDVHFENPEENTDAVSENGQDSALLETESSVGQSEMTSAEERKVGAEAESETGEETEAKEESQAPVTYSFVSADTDYFDDALFIGDSRTQGMAEYGGFQEETTFYCKTSLTVYDLFKKEKAFIKEDDRKMTLRQALSEHQFGKIYLMLGINELGTGTPESFFEEYARAVLQIRQLQPDAIIFVQAIMRVGAEKNADDQIFNNTNINIRNVELATLHDGQNIFYVDVNEVTCDESGSLFDGWTYDQVHLKAKYYQVWKDYLLEHAIVRN